MRLRKKENTELRDVNDLINQNSELLKRYTDENSLNIITREIEKCKQERDTILQKQGESLSMKAKHGSTTKAKGRTSTSSTF
jgi:hypothetical protein